MIDLDYDAKCFLLSLLSLGVLLVVANLSYMFIHENIHGAICRTYGGTPSFDYSQFYIKATTTCYGLDEDSTAHFLNSWVEIIGYHFQVAMNVWIGWKACELLIKRIEKEV